MVPEKKKRGRKSKKELENIKLQSLLDSSNNVAIEPPKKEQKKRGRKPKGGKIIEIIKTHTNIEYFAISNVESKNDLSEYIEKLPNSITLIPKIESHIGIENIEEIAKSLDYKSRVMMLDHDDLYSNLLKSKQPLEKFVVYINQLTEFCKSNDIILLRTIGVIFSDEEKRISDYVN